MSVQEELEQVTRVLMKADVHIKQLIKDLYEVRMLDTLNELNQEINVELKKFKQLQHKLNVLIDDCCLPDEKHGAKTRSQGFAHQFESNCQSLRKAYTQSKKAVEEQMTRDLFDRTGFESQLTRRSTTNADGSKAPVHDKAYVMNKSAGITNNLYQITKLMSEQVEQSNAALNALVTSSSMVNETQQEFNQMGSHLINSRTLLTKYGRREFTDKLVIALAFLFFLSCVLYVTIKRFF